MEREKDENKIKKKEIIIDAEIKDEDDKKVEQVIVEDVKKETKKIKTKKKKNDEINIGVVFGITILLSVISGFLGAYIILGSKSNYVTSEGDIITSNAKLEETNSISGAVDKIYDAVVVVEVYNKDTLVSTGTGFVYKKKDNKAYLMTNNHVLPKEGAVKVLFTNGKELDAKVVGSDVYSDIAVLSVEDNKDIVSAVLGKNADVKVGDTVFAVGSPEGSDYAGTVTKGIISARERIVEVALANSQLSDYYMKVLQTDAAINPGNSGGPICNINGEVIGITNMKLVDDTVEGMGFAIPIEDALEMATVLEENGKVVRPYVGIEMLDLTNEFNLWKAGIMLPEGIESGVAVYNVVGGSPADDAGLKKGDIITKLGGKDINGLADFRYELYKHKPDEEVEVVFVREGKEKKTTIKLGDGE